MTTKATRHPGRVARKTGHVVVAVRELLVVGGNVAPGCVVLAHRFGVARLRAVVARVVRVDRVNRLSDAPFTAGYAHRVLNDVARLEKQILAILALHGAIARGVLEESALVS